MEELHITNSIPSLFQSIRLIVAMDNLSHIKWCVHLYWNIISWLIKVIFRIQNWVGIVCELKRQRMCVCDTCWSAMLLIFWLNFYTSLMVWCSPNRCSMLAPSCYLYHVPPCPYDCIHLYNCINQCINHVKQKKQIQAHQQHQIIYCVSLGVIGNCWSFCKSD